MSERPLPAVATAIIKLINREPHIVVTARVPHADYSYSYPGGAVEPGEPPDRAASREILEETGLHIPPRKLTPVPGLDPVPDRGRTFTLRLFYHFLSPGSPVRPKNTLPQLHRGWQWAPLEGLIAAEICGHIPSAALPIALLEIIRSQTRAVTGRPSRSAYYHPRETPAAVTLPDWPY